MNIQSSAYVSTASKWLPEPPLHWKIKPFRHCFRPSDERNGSTPIGEMLSVSGYRGVVVKDYEFEEQKRTAEELETYRVVRPGQLAVNTMWLNYTGLGVSEHLGYVSPAYRSYWIKPGLHGRFVHHLLRSSVYVAGYTSLLQGIRPNSLQVPTDAFHSIPILIPPLEEQQIIAAYLDRETGRIDALVERLERLIALLTEKRQAVISHAVTKGLNPDAPMKDSGIDWLGEVPAHWEVSRFAWVNRPDQSITYGIVQAGPEIEGGVPYIRVSDMQRQPVTAADLPKTSVEIARNYRRSELVAGDIVVCIRASIGKPMLVTDDLIGANLTQGTAKISPGEGVSRLFVYYAVQSDCCTGWFEQFAKGATFKEITLECLRNTPIPVPPLQEQDDIAAFLVDELAQIDGGIGSSQTAINTLKERRSALISAAVTGQIPIAVMTPDTQPEDAA